MDKTAEDLIFSFSRTCFWSFGVRWKLRARARLTSKRLSNFSRQLPSSIVSTGFDLFLRVLRACTCGRCVVPRVTPRDGAALEHAGNDGEVFVLVPPLLPLFCFSAPLPHLQHTPESRDGYHLLTIDNARLVYRDEFV